MGALKREGKEGRERDINKDVHVCLSYMTESFPEERCHDSFSYVSPKVLSNIPYLVELSFSLT